MSVKVDRLTIRFYPDPVLRRPTEPVGEVTDEVRAVADRMIELMQEASGVGLAAPQVGLSWRMFVANPSGEPGEERVFIDPTLDEASEQLEDHPEGCLSIPEVRAIIRRPKSIAITATDLDGERFTLRSDELPARVWQHETDHLDGVLILDRMNAMDKLANRKIVRELEKTHVGR